MPLSNFVLRRYGHEDNEREDVRLPMGRIEFGRTNKCYKQFESIYVSRMHCRITVQNDAISIKDANTSNGTFVNSIRIDSTEISLRHGDIIGLGCDVDAATCSSSLTKYVMYRVCYLIQTIDLDEDVTVKNEVNVKDEGDSDIVEFDIEEKMRIKQETLELDAYLKDFDDVIVIESSDSDNDISSWRRILSQNQLFIDGKIKKEELSDTVVISDLDDPMQECSRIKTFRKRRTSVRRISSESEEEEPEQPLKIKKRRIIQRPVDSDPDDVVLVEVSASDSKDTELHVPNKELEIRNKAASMVIKEKELVLDETNTEIINKQWQVCIPILKERPKSMSPNASDTSNECKKKPRTHSSKNKKHKHNGDSLLFDNSSTSKKQNENVVPKKHTKQQDAIKSETPPPRRVSPLRIQISNGGEMSIKPFPKRRHSTVPAKHTQQEMLSKTGLSNGQTKMIRRNSDASINRQPSQINGNVSPKDLKSIISEKKSKAPEKKPILIPAIPIDKSSRKALEATKHILKVADSKAKFNSQASPRQSRSEKTRKEVIISERKYKLKDLADSKKTSLKPSKKTQTKPKVKFTDKNRGFFLTPDANLPPPPPQSHKTVPNVNELQVGTTSTSVIAQKEIPSRVNNACDKKRISHASKQNTVEPQPSTSTTEPQPSTSTTEPQPSTSAGLTNGHWIVSDKPSVDTTTDDIDKLVDMSIRTFNMPLPDIIPSLTDDFLPPSIIDLPNERSIKPCLVKPGVDRKPKRSLKFNERTELSYYERIYDFNSVLTDVTSWMPGWLDDPNHNVNGIDHILMPITLQYNDIDSYHKIMIPLMKVELWYNISTEYKIQMDGHLPIDILLHDANYEWRGSGYRQVFHCEIAVNIINLTEGDLVILTHGYGKNIKEFFALVTEVKYTTKRNIQAVYFTMEAAKVDANKKVSISTKFTLKQVSNVKIQLKEFKSMLNLSESDLLQNILHPNLNAIVPRENYLFAYKGRDALNSEQMNILRQVYLRCHPSEKPIISLINGAPGTGKSKLISNLIMQFIYGTSMRKPDKILVCAHSNAAVDVIVKKLLAIQMAMTNPLQEKFKLVRFGKIDKMDPAVRQLSVELLNRNNIKQCGETLNNKKKLLNLKLRALSFQKGENTNTKDKEIVQNEIKLVEGKIAELSSQQTDTNIYHKYLNQADVICTTLNSCYTMHKFISKNSIPICIIDEATQCTEPSTCVPLEFGVRSLILVGDTKQLPAVVKSSVAAEHNLKDSLLQRMHNFFLNSTSNPVFRLNKQYRMNPEICRFINTHFYKGHLESAGSVDPKFPLRPYTVLSLASMQSCILNRPLHMISTSNEADFIVSILKILKPVIDQKYTIGVITPYTTHKNELADKLQSIDLKYLSVNTIDAYQGQEKDITIISLGRSRSINFLADYQRLNVALTRARKCLILCGNFRELPKNPTWEQLLQDAVRREKFHTISDQIDTYSFINNIKEILFTEETFRSQTQAQPMNI